MYVRNKTNFLSLFNQATLLWVEERQNRKEQI